MFNSELTDQIEREFRFDTALIEAEKNHAYNSLVQSLTKPVIKLSKKQAKNVYLYKRLDGQVRLA